MRSRAEWVVRVAVIGLLAWSLWRALQPVSPVAGSANARTVRQALTKWTTTAPPPASVHVVIDTGSGLPGYARQWLVALGQSGTRVTWSSTTPLLATAIDVEPVADPSGATRVQVAAPAGAAVVIGDALGPFDTVRVVPGANGVSAIIPASVRTATAVVGGLAATGAASDSLTLRRILVLGRAGWESKFVVRALEEEGWLVDAELRVTPKYAVLQGHPGAIDTIRYAAVVAVDSAPSVEAYVRSGGGLVAHGRRRDTLAMEADQMGRIARVGYDSTWRWRMADGDSGLARHRAWWSAIVARVAYAPRTGRPIPTDVDAAPLAHLVDALGAPSAASAKADGGRPVDPTRHAWVFGALLAALLLEWASRRARGRR
jgi:hypothetical protein